MQVWVSALLLRQSAFAFGFEGMFLRSTQTKVLVRSRTSLFFPVVGEAFLFSGVDACSIVINMKKPKKFINKSSRINPTPKEQEIPQEQLCPKPNYKKTLFWVIGGALFAVILIAIGFFIGHQENTYNPYQDLKGYESSRHAFMVKSAEVSVKMADRAVQALKKKNIKEAIEDCRIAIDIFPIDAKPYILLTKLYLMTGQEQKMYETLTLAGRSYPNFDNIVGIIDDENLDKIPLDESSDNTYLANFPENKKMAISFLFDDGEKNIYDNAVPIFEKNGFRATIPIIAGFTPDKSNDSFWGSWTQWKDAANRGFEIANHSMYHRDSRKLHGSDFDIAIDQAKEIIEKNIGHKVTAYVFPHDSYTDEAISRALREHKAVRAWEFLQTYYSKTVGITYGGPHFSLETANRLVDIGLKRRLWVVANCHGVTLKQGILSFKSITPSFLAAHLSYIHSKSDEVWVDTFSNVFEYMSLRAQTKIETKSFTADSIDFVLHHDKQQKMSEPLTVVVKTPEGSKVKSAVEEGAHALKVWSCAADKLCVDVDSYEKNVHVEWD